VLKYTKPRRCKLCLTKNQAIKTHDGVNCRTQILNHGIIHSNIILPSAFESFPRDLFYLCFSTKLYAFLMTSTYATYSTHHILLSNSSFKISYSSFLETKRREREVLHSQVYLCLSMHHAMKTY